MLWQRKKWKPSPTTISRNFLSPDYLKGVHYSRRRTKLEKFCNPLCAFPLGDFAHAWVQSCAHNWSCTTQPKLDQSTTAGHIDCAFLRRVEPLACFATSTIWSTNPFWAPQLSVGIGIRLISHSSCQFKERRKGRGRWYICCAQPGELGGHMGEPGRSVSRSIQLDISCVLSDCENGQIYQVQLCRGLFEAHDLQDKCPSGHSPRARWNWIWFDVQFYSGWCSAMLKM